MAEQAAGAVTDTKAKEMNTDKQGGTAEAREGYKKHVGEHLDHLEEHHQHTMAHAEKMDEAMDHEKVLTHVSKHKERVKAHIEKAKSHLEHVEAFEKRLKEAPKGEGTKKPHADATRGARSPQVEGKGMYPSARS